MKYKIADSKPVSRIPEVGDLWRHHGSFYVYLRIADDEGRRVLPNLSVDVFFFSVSVSDGFIASTGRDGFNGEVLKLRDETLIPA